ncbi:hypothetical protein OPQ81_003866 [Rhizoctonia solani]|nr:hypothetical protein OPQ81_003866 [Rhizoctonia solani]
MSSRSKHSQQKPQKLGSAQERNTGLAIFAEPPEQWKKRYRRQLTNGLLTLRKLGEYGEPHTALLSTPELLRFWLSSSSPLTRISQRKGNQLGKSFRSDSTPSWRGMDISPLSCEDSADSMLVRVLDAIRIHDGQQVMIKMNLPSRTDSEGQNEFALL